MLKLQEITCTDLTACTEVFVTVCNSEPFYDNWTLTQAKKYLTDYYNTPRFLGVLAIEDQKIVGYLFGNCRKWWSADEFYIHELGVDPDRQRQGIGKALLAWIQTKLAQQNIHHLTLLTDRGIPAETFYKANGFEEIERVQFMYKKF